MIFTPENVQRFDEYIKSLNLRNFEPYEFRVHCEARYNGLPPASIWPNIAPTAFMLDVIRDELGIPIFLNSVYRSKRYNDTIPGSASNSNHRWFCACDCRFFKTPVNAKLRDKIDSILKRGLTNKTIVRAGRGYYAGSFIHIDTNHNNGARPIGRLATWSG